MTNEELELKLAELVTEDNFLTMAEEMAAFNKEYKKTDFYKKTRIKLPELVKNYKIHSMIKFESIENRVQNMIDNLSYDNIKNILNEFLGKFENDNANFFKDLEDVASTINDLEK